MEISDLFGTDENGVETRIDIEQAIGDLTFRERQPSSIYGRCARKRRKRSGILSGWINLKYAEYWQICIKVIRHSSIK